MFIIKGWNGKYGQDAVFIVEDQGTGKQGLYVVGMKQEHVSWLDVDLCSACNFEDFCNEEVGRLEEIVF
ncbi:hypothetical protein Goe26_00930 [Bacillus phage vB_BsuM-Goe26]|nr:hypothetical protein Goe26_00930 [Bacillus phage vB_BsuM-Goe26]